MDEKENVQTNFIRNIIDTDLASGKHDSVFTRFPPEPNGYLHIGHAKSICLNFGIARDYQGKCNLRFDDTNPDKEEEEYMHAIMDDVRWLGFEWTEERHASDYFDQLYMFAVKLIQVGKAYVDSQSADNIRNTRGTLKDPGVESPYRNRSIEENLNMFQRMKDGEFPDGTHVLRAKIDMASPNINMRDPVLYRIKRTHHHRTGDDWVIYPMYDFTHCLSDALEGITHSICTLEFEDHRPLYDWVLDEADAPCHPQQIEFARLQLKYTVTSKRKLHQLVHDNHVDGWDDPRMPTISGLRRRGFTPVSIRDFCDRIGVTKKDSFIEMAVLENSAREDMNEHALRVMAVLNPLKVTIANYPGDQVEMMVAQNHPQHPEMGTREVPFSKTLYIERDDFMEDAPKKFFRLSVGREVRLRYAYYITCTDVIKDDNGEVVELICSYDPATRGGDSPDGRKVKGTIHWVSAAHAINAKVNLYDRLFTHPNPGGTDDFVEHLNPESLIKLEHCKLEPSLSEADPDKHYQFERTGYFVKDSHEELTFNRTVTLRDTWAKIDKQNA
ncbi:MAG: glutamine--tRNA ligase/YqeY domain fusion protein, partial [Gammaproteobacteria bacterium]|nr:glutamine--tRNA ligase/YqeY domain fusion protein [Gammaproteobacteria bacterium]